MLRKVPDSAAVPVHQCTTWRWLCSGLNALLQCYELRMSRVLLAPARLVQATCSCSACRQLVAPFLGWHIFIVYADLHIHACEVGMLRVAHNLGKLILGTTRQRCFLLKTVNGCISVLALVKCCDCALVRWQCFGLVESSSALVEACTTTELCLVDQYQCLRAIAQHSFVTISCSICSGHGEPKFEDASDLQKLAVPA
jgi:hypothetical protein